MYASASVDQVFPPSIVRMVKPSMSCVPPATIPFMASLNRTEVRSFEPVSWIGIHDRPPSSDRRIFPRTVANAFDALTKLTEVIEGKAETFGSHQFAPESYETATAAVFQ